MACLDDLVTAIQNLSFMAANPNCGCGSGGGPATSPPASTEDTGDITETEGTPPDGYDNWLSYQTKKCDIASWIVTNLKNDIQWLQTVDIAVITLVALAAGLAGFMSANVVLLILSVVLAIAAYSPVVLDDGEAAVSNGFDDLVCALVTGTNASDSISQFVDAMETAINAETADTVARALLLQLMSYWADTTSVNLMYAPLADVDMVQVPIGGDCSECGLACQTDYIQYGALISGDVWQSELAGGVHRIRLWFRSDGDHNDCSDFCGPMQSVKVAVSGWSNPTNPFDSFRFWSDDECPFGTGSPDVYSSDTPVSPSTAYCMRLMDIISATAFTATLTEREDCI